METQSTIETEERACSDCGKPNQHEFAETGDSLQKSWRGEDVYLCHDCRHSTTKRNCPSCDVEMSFYCSHCQQEFEQ